MTFQKGDYNLLESYYRAVSNPLPEMKKTFEMENEILSKYIELLPVTREKRSILDVGCGIGRPLLDLSVKYYDPFVEFKGIDNNECNLSVARIRLNDITDTIDPVVSFENQDAHYLPGKFHDNFDLVYSTYNTIGSIDSGHLWNFIYEQSKAVKKNGYVINFTWSRLRGTTSFLKQYYPHIGLKLKTISEDKIVLENAIIHRLHPDLISQLYKRVGIKTQAVEQANLWSAVIGRKL